MLFNPFNSPAVGSNEMIVWEIQTVDFERGLPSFRRLVWHRLSATGESTSTSVEGFSAWSWSHISNGAHLPLRAYFVKLMAKIGIDSFQLIPSSYKLLGGWYVFCKMNKLEVPSSEEIFYFYSVKANPMRTNKKKLDFFRQDKHPNSYCPIRHTNRTHDLRLPSQSIKTAEVVNKVAQYGAFNEEQLRVEEWITTELLRRSSIIENFQNIDPVNLRGKRQAPKEEKGKGKVKYRASRIRKPRPASTSSSLDVWEIAPPIKASFTALGSLALVGGQGENSYRHSGDVQSISYFEGANLEGNSMGGGSDFQHFDRYERPGIALGRIPPLDFSFPMRPAVLSHKVLTKMDETTLTLNKHNEREQFILQKRSNRLSVVKTVEITEGIRQPSPSGSILDLVEVTQNLVHRVGREVAPFATKMLEQVGTSMSELTFEKWAVSSSHDSYTLSVVAKQHATRVEQDKTQATQDVKDAQDACTAKLMVMEKELSAKY
uniref:Uncharacterized protein n=1 Tax=Cannabis sativa TaxID=3483 RepID=A0A803PTM6_CANSA